MLPANGVRVYLALGATDMRQSIDGFILVSQQLQVDSFAGHLLGFCNRSLTIVKLLYWDRNGFCLWQKRLKCHVFRWPVSEIEAMPIDSRELSWLLSGHPRKADASATLYSRIETAKANGMKPYRYLRHLFEHLPVALPLHNARRSCPNRF